MALSAKEAKEEATHLVLTMVDGVSLSFVEGREGTCIRSRQDARTFSIQLHAVIARVYRMLDYEYNVSREGAIKLGDQFWDEHGEQQLHNWNKWGR